VYNIPVATMEILRNHVIAAYEKIQNILREFLNVFDNPCDVDAKQASMRKEIISSKNSVKYRYKYKIKNRYKFKIKYRYKYKIKYRYKYKIKKCL